MPVARGNANSLVKEFMAFQTLWESQKNDPKSDTVGRQEMHQIQIRTHPNIETTLPWEDSNFRVSK